MEDSDRYILQDRDGDYVSAITNGETETVKTHFAFTKIRGRAMAFTYRELWDPKGTATVGVEFTKGYAGGRAIRLAPF
jgi:hypothetical protein